MALNEKRESISLLGLITFDSLSNQQAPGRGRGLQEKLKETWPSSNIPWKVNNLAYCVLSRFILQQGKWEVADTDPLSLPS